MSRDGLVEDLSRHSGAAPPGQARVRALPLHTGAGVRCAVDVSDNTNLWGTAPAVLRVLAASPAQVSRYPSAYSEELSEAVLGYLSLGTASDMGVVFGCGSDDVLDAAMRAFGAPGDRIAYSVPTFSMIPTLAALSSLEPVEVPLLDSFDIDAERLVESRASIIYVCAPNNPTGTSVSRTALEHVLRHAPGLVILDEAYAEFARDRLTDLVLSHASLLVTRTFSKAFGLAGLRVGYGVGTSAVTDVVARARGPYKVNTLAERAVLAALADTAESLGWVRERVALACVARDRLAADLRAAGLDPLRSDANFVFVPLANARAVSDRMLRAGVAVRAFAGLSGAAALERSGGAGLRIGVGPEAQMTLVLDALRTALHAEVEAGR